MAKLHGTSRSRSARSLWALEELGVNYEHNPMPTTDAKSPGHLKLNPNGHVPVLEDEGVVIWESMAINLYLAEKYGKGRLLPEDLQERALVNRWLLFTATELEQPLWRIARHTNLYPKDKRLPAEVLLARKDFEDMAKVMEKHMSTRQFLVGDRASVADFVAAYTLDWANEIHLLDSAPHLREYMERVYARPKAAPRIAAALASVRAGAPEPTS